MRISLTYIVIKCYEWQADIVSVRNQSKEGKNHG
jgi:hypothetical protein